MTLNLRLLLTFLISIAIATMYVYTKPLLSVALIGAGFAYIVLSKRIYVGVYALLLWTPLQYFVTSYYYGILPKSFVWLDEVILALMFVLTLVRILTKKNKINISSVDKFVFLFCSFSLFSGLVNLVNPIVGVLGVRAFLQYYLLYFVIKNNDFHFAVIKNISRILLFSALFQIPVSIYQFFSWKPVAVNKYGFAKNSFDLSWYDAVVGTFGSGAANNFGYLMLMVILFVMGIYYVSRKKTYLILAISLMIPFVFSQSRAAFGLFFLIILFLVRKDIKKNFGKVFASLIIFVSLFLVVLSAYLRYSDYEFKDAFNIEGIIQQQMEVSPSASGRIAGLIVANNLLFEESPSFLLGVGPGMFSSSTGKYFKAPLYVKTVNKLRSVRSISESAIVPMLAEYGYLGLTIYILMVFSMLRVNAYIYKLTRNINLRSFCFGNEGVLLVYLIGACFSKLWEVQYIAAYVWLGMGIIEKMYIDEKSNKVICKAY